MTKIINICSGEPYDEYIGRPSIFGNPFTHIKDRKTNAEFIVNSREESIIRYKKYFYDKLNKEPEFKNAVLALKDKTLSCWCKPLCCHGDVIVEFLDR